MWFFGSMMALYMIYLMIKWGLIIGAVIIGLWLVVAIINKSGVAVVMLLTIKHVRLINTM